MGESGGAPSEQTVESVDVLHEDGSPAGLIKPKPHVHRDGDWHRAAHLWFVTPGGRFLVQRRSPTKENHPALWDVSCAGHLSAGETAEEAAVREAKEELGLQISPHELEHVASLPERYVLNGGSYIDNEIHEIFLVRRPVEPSALRLQQEEVSEVRLVSWEEFVLMDRVPHRDEYELMARWLRSPGE